MCSHGDTHADNQVQATPNDFGSPGSIVRKVYPSPSDDSTINLKPLPHLLPSNFSLYLHLTCVGDWLSAHLLYSPILELRSTPASAAYGSPSRWTTEWIFIQSRERRPPPIPLSSVTFAYPADHNLHNSVKCQMVFIFSFLFTSKDKHQRWKDRPLKYE